MESLAKCANCGQIPTQLSDRPDWNEHTQLDSTAGSKLTEAKSATVSGAGTESEQLQEIYLYYCNRAPKSDSLDNSKWAKLLVDLHWLDAKMTKTDGDLIFSKVKPKGGRKVEFDEFVLGVHEVAKKRYGSEDLTELLRSTTIPKQQSESSPNVVDRLTNPANYTGSHKLRFDEEGKGKGMDGREASGVNDKLIVGKVIPGGKKINLAESLREDVSADNNAKNATHCPQCNAPRKPDQRSCARCGKLFF